MDEETKLSANEGVDPEDIREDGEGLEVEHRRMEGEEHSEAAAEEEENQSGESGNYSRSEHVSSKEHTLDDLAGEEAPSEGREEEEGREPAKPRRLFVDNDKESILGNQLPSSGVYSGNKKGNWGKLLLLLLIGVLVIGGSVYLLKGRIKSANLSSPSPSLSINLPSPTPTPSPSPAVDRSKFKIRVLNGTATSGLAASVSAKLKSLGYQQDRVGNASNSAFTQTWVRVKDSAVGLADQLIKDLAPDYSASTNGSLLASDSADGEVILGTH